MILKPSDNENDASLKSSFETLENQERIDGHDNFLYSNLSNTNGSTEPSERVVDGNLKSPDLLVDPKDGNWNPMVVIIASCCIGRILILEGRIPDFHFLAIEPCISIASRGWRGIIGLCNLPRAKQRISKHCTITSMKRSSKK